MTTTTGIGVHDQNLERQIEKHMGGCMAGFFNLFDRNHILAGKRLYPKRLPPPLPSSVVPESSPEPVSPRGFKKPQSVYQTPEASPKSPAVIGDPSKSPLAVSTFEFKEAVKSPWKFSREAPRLSLDSRAIVDAKGGLHPREMRINTTTTAVSPSGDDNQRRSGSPSVIARLMGLEPPLTSSPSPVPEPTEKKVELRRSASESRSRDYRFFDAPSFLSPIAGKSEMTTLERKSDHQPPNNRASTNVANNVANSKTTRNQSTQRRMVVERRSHYDTADIFPPEKLHHHNHHHNHQAVTIYWEIEKRLRMRGIIDEPSKDLETLKHILEALQLKGLLHSSTSHNNVFVGDDRRFHEEEESPIVLMKPGSAPPPTHARRNAEQSVSPRRARSPGRSASPGVRRKGGSLSVETQRRVSETTTTTTTPTTTTPRSAHSPRRMRRSQLDQTVSRSPRNRRSTVEASPEDEASTVSESSFSTSSHTDNEYREGRNLLERCDKLLHSIAEMTSMTSNSNSDPNSAELQKPSPVSVLDPSFYKEDESSPSPVKKRSIDFKDQVPVMELEDEQWSPSSSSSKHLPDYQDHHQDMDSTSDGSDFSYVSEVLRASMYLPEETDLFLLLEKKQGCSGGKASVLQRRLIFDTITEILGRARQLPLWKAARPTLRQIWAELTKIQERGPSDDLLEVICGVLKKDLAGDSANGWGDCHMEVSEAVLDIERLIFKDLITETIRDVAAFSGGRGGGVLPRRKLVF